MEGGRLEEPGPCPEAASGRTAGKRAGRPPGDGGRRREMAEWSTAEALRTALRYEREFFERYGKSAAEATDPAVKAMFEFLAGEERKHMNLVLEMMERHDVEP
jgi:rubrerythrin